MLVFHVITSLNVGGAEQALKKLVLNLPESIQVKVVTLHSLGPIADDLKDCGIDVECLGIKGVRDLFKSIERLRKLFVQCKPDVVQTWLYHSDLIGGVAAKLAGVNHIVWGVRTTELKKGAWATSMVRKCCAILSKKIPKYIICVASSAEEKHRSLGYCSEKLKVIGNGFDDSSFEDSDERGGSLNTLFKNKDNDVVIGTVGRFSQDKAQDLFVEAAGIVAGRYPKVKFVMVGRGNDESNKKLMSLINEAGIESKVLLLGERRDISNCFNSFDVFCLHSRTEGFPNVLAEAMLHSLPCVTTKAGDSELILGGVGGVAQDFSAKAIADALAEMLSLSSARRAELGKKSRERVMKNYSIDSYVDSYVSLYKKMISGE